MEDILKIAFSALLHDIGKLYQRSYNEIKYNDNMLEKFCALDDGTYTHIHSLYTYMFIEKYLPGLMGIAEYASKHHIDIDNSEHAIIRKADSLSSEIDGEDEKYDIVSNKEEHIKIRLESIFYQLELDSVKEASYLKLTKYSELEFYENDDIVNGKIENVDNAIKEYRELFNNFVKEIEKSNIDLTVKGFNKLYSILKEYTTLVPATSYKIFSTSVGLFDHLKLTTAVASALYYTDNKEEFEMLEYDLSGIQNFIFKITEGGESKTGITASLRGRSLFITLLSNYIANKFVNEYGLTQANIIYSTGGGGMILLPALSIDKLNAVKNDIDKLIQEKFNTSIAVSFGSVKLNSTEKLHELTEFRNDKSLILRKDIGLSKRTKGNRFILNCDNTILTSDNGSKHICSFCGDVTTNSDKCSNCSSIEELGRKVVGLDHYYIIFDFNNTSNNIDGWKYELGTDCIYITSDYNMASKYEYVQSYNAKNGYGDNRFTANLVPKSQKDNRTLSFNEIADLNEKGDNKLAFLKMDVDDLGSLMSFGLKTTIDNGKGLEVLQKTRSLSKVLTLSRNIEYFFTKKLCEICRNTTESLKDVLHENTSNCFYINYAGGDDLLIVGPAVAIMKLSIDIHNSFTDFTKNKGVTISGGITVEGPKKPARFAIDLAEEYLEHSKDLEGKNGITIFGISKKIEDFKNIYNNSLRYVEWLEQGKISRTFLYNILTILNTTESSDDYKKSIPRVAYSIARNLSNKEVADEVKAMLIKNLDMDEIQNIVLTMKLIMIQTRDGK